MSEADFIKRYPHGSTHNKIPFIVSMIDSDYNPITIPYPPEEVLLGYPGEQIYGVELIINPSTLSSNLAKTISRTPSMTAFVEDHWGEELDTLTVQGHTATFVTGGTDIYSMKLSPANNATRDFVRKYKSVSYGPGVGIDDSDPGVTVSQRRKSLSYKQFKRLLDIFRLNGCLFDSFGMVSRRYYIMMSFGNVAYKGFFENVDVTEVATDPFRYQYTITFKSEETLYSYINRDTNG